MTGPINDDYKTGIKREIVGALRPMFGSTFPYVDLRNQVYVGLEYPMEPVNYPAIYITFNEREIRNIGVGHIEQAVDDNLLPYKVKRWWFEGTINFNIIALNPLDRDRLAAALINILAFHHDGPEEFSAFYDELYDADYVDLTLMTERIIPGGEQVGATPWDSEDELQYGNSYSVAVSGEFTSNASTNDLVQISTIRVSGYTPGEAPPW